MARTQQALQGDGPAIRFANRLRHARQSAGLTLRRLSEISGYSVGALSNAESGRKIPSWDLTEAFVRACRQPDVGRWRGWWESERERELADRAAVPVPVELAPEPVTAAPGPSVRRLRQWSRWALAPVTAVVSIALTLAVTSLVQPPPARSTSLTTPTAVATSTTPGCVPIDQSMVAATPVKYRGNVVGQLELWHSANCDTNWARFQLRPGWKYWVSINAPTGVRCFPTQCTMQIAGHFSGVTAMLFDRNGPAMAIGYYQPPGGSVARLTAGTPGTGN